jgi:BirA family biotin operon repressor/biotin-[acetyl-CoA-carboxylase] ligase
VIAWRLECFSALDSTSDFCIARAKDGEPEGLAILAEAQTAGRGSRGRHWDSAPGNLFLSVLLRPAVTPAQNSVFPLLAGVAVAEAVQKFLPSGQKPMLKWPNDIMLGGAKLAGLLIDAAPRDWLVIGIGVNLRHAPKIPGRVTTAIGPSAPAPKPAAAAILERLSAWLEVFAQDGPAPIQAAWLAAAHPIGTEIQVRGLHRTASGRFAGLSRSGELLLAVENRIEIFSTGEIVLGLEG